MKKKDTVVDIGPPQILISSKSKSKRGGHLTPKCLFVYIRTFGWPMGAVLYDFCAVFKQD